jgi:hypothetical protein
MPAKCVTFRMPEMCASTMVFELTFVILLIKAIKAHNEYHIVAFSQIVQVTTVLGTSSSNAKTLSKLIDK